VFRKNQEMEQSSYRRNFLNPDISEANNEEDFESRLPSI